MQRVFFSFHVPESTGKALLQNLQKQVSFPLYPQENLHITLQFAGEVTNEQLNQLQDAGDALSREFKPIEITPDSFSIEQGRLRLTVETDPLLLDIQKQLTSKIEAIEGITLKKQKYAPHITLGRPSEDFSISSLSITPGEFAFTATAFGLYKSEPGKDGLGNYTLIKEFQLGDTETETNIHTILLPARPQPDTIVAIFLLKTFGQEQYPGIENAKITIRPTPPEGETESSLFSKGILPMDIMGGKFDHHKQGGTASQLIAKNLGIERSPALAKLLAYAERDDKYGKGTISQDLLDKAFGLSGLIASLNKTMPDNPQGVVDTILPILHGHYVEEHKRTVELPQEYKDKLKSGEAESIDIKHKGKNIRIVFLIAQSPSMAGWLRSSIGVKADVVVQKIDTEHVNIMTRPLKKVDLRWTAALLREQEAAKRGIQLQYKASELTKPGRIQEIPYWYYDRATNSILNGGTNPGDTEATAIPFQEIKNIVIQGLEKT